jgi:hypothetical protein
MVNWCCDGAELAEVPCPSAVSRTSLIGKMSRICFKSWDLCASMRKFARNKFTLKCEKVES